MEKQKKYLLNKCSCGEFFIHNKGSLAVCKSCGENGEIRVERATKDLLISKFKEIFKNVEYKEFHGGLLFFPYNESVYECVRFAVRTDSFGLCVWEDELDYWAADAKVRFDLQKTKKECSQCEIVDAAFVASPFTIIPFLDHAAA